MTKEEIVAKVKTIVAPYVQHQENFEKLSEETDFITDLAINSANLVDVILDVEDEFGIELNNDDMEQMLTVKASIAIIEKKLAVQ